MRSVLICLFLIGLALPAFSQVEELNYDSSALDIRTYDLHKLESYKLQKVFQYDFKHIPVETWWQRLWRKFLEWLGQMPGWSLLMQIIFYAALLFILILLIMSFLGISLKTVFYKKPTHFSIPVRENEVNIHETNFDVLIQECIERADYRSAVRHGYLKILKLLNDSHLILWEKNKTNRQYINELTGNGLRESFGKICQQYEYTWYGHFDITESTYRTFYTICEELTAKLNEKRVA